MWMIDVLQYPKSHSLILSLKVQNVASYVFNYLKIFVLCENFSFPKISSSETPIYYQDFPYKLKITIIAHARCVI